MGGEGAWCGAWAWCLVVCVRAVMEIVWEWREMVFGCVRGSGERCCVLLRCCFVVWMCALCTQTDVCVVRHVVEYC